MKVFVRKIARKVFEVVGAVGCVGVAGVVGTAGVGNAAAMTTLKQVQVSNSAQIDLLFDGKINNGQIQTEFFNDIIQLSLIDVTVYPAKISSVSGGVLSKVFAYQYAPRLVRCRLTVSGKAENYKDRLQISSSGKVMTIKIADPAASASPAGTREDRISVPAAAPVRSAANAQEGRDPSKPAKMDPAEEKALLDHVMNAPLQRAAAPTKNEPAKSGPKVEPRKPKALPSFTGILMKLALVLGIFGASAIFIKKLLAPKGNRLVGRGVASMLGDRWNSLGGALGRFAKNGIGKLGHKEKMIEVLSTHHLGPKQSIAVVRVCGRKMVLGIANESISLISQLSGEGAEFDGIESEASLPPATGATTGDPAILAGLFSAGKESWKEKAGFASFLTQSHAEPDFGKPGAVPAATSRVSGAGTSASVRARIRSRLEGLKPL